MRVFAQEVEIAGQVIRGPLNGRNIIGRPVENLGDLLSLFLAFIYPLAGLFILYFLLLAGYRLIMSRGDMGKVAEAKKSLSISFLGWEFLFRRLLSPDFSPYLLILAQLFYLVDVVYLGS
ncbi:MAG: hypothetical protein UZ21_OP11001000602 [Microgenomates bacterium OLB22]|nr:MAG: hypothetical protein UZ21_OP11001000602 [Microgenomates bacterium OLB22]